MLKIYGSSDIDEGTLIKHGQFPDNDAVQKMGNLVPWQQLLHSSYCKHKGLRKAREQKQLCRVHI
ncbi:hypothetical protein MBANPS3_012591 [Mucor bainieri]